MSSVDDLERLLVQHLRVHRGEPEIRNPGQLSDDILDRYQRDRLLSMENQSCYGILPDFARVLFNHLDPGMKTLETGVGVSTLVFALAETWHTAITPEGAEGCALRLFANTAGIDLSRVTFAVVPSERYLPTCNLRDLDVVFLDGKHAFPWPAIDWFYAADCLKTGGLMILDDIQLNSVRIVTEFMDVDPHWRFESNPGERTAIYRKLASPVHDVAWYMQPWVHEIKPPLYARAVMQARRVTARVVRVTPLGRLLSSRQRRGP
jgi:hypothetical protein